MVVTESRVSTEQTGRAGIVDCDVHVFPRNIDEIKSRMPMPWRDLFKGAARGFFGTPVHGSRLDSVPPDGGPVGSDPDFLRKQLVDEFGVAYCILLPRAFCNLQPDPDFGSAIAAAYNDWLADTWLSTYNHDVSSKGPSPLIPKIPLPPPKRLNAGPVTHTSYR